IFDGVNPQGCEVTSFKQPTIHELNHDFMWRSMIALPARGRSGIFNRSYYEECLVTRVHHDLLDKEKIPRKLITPGIWQERFADISAIENYLSRNGTVILKFFLNVSKKEQRERFLDRLEQPAKNWKFSMNDVTERAFWPRYMAAYQDVIRHTSTPYAPWHVVPSDHKWFARVAIGSAIVSALEELNLRFPRVDKASQEEFAKVRKALESEGRSGAGGATRAVKRPAKRG
ncbi:MAG: PPK2 family polyphosphate kinase, partial [Bradyrhizobium sp.]